MAGKCSGEAWRAASWSANLPLFPGASQMSRLSIAAAALALSLFGLAATPAAALEAGCLWSNLAESKRASLLADYRARGMAALQSLQISDQDVATWPARCGVTPQNAEKSGMLLGTVIIEKGVVDALQTTHGVTPAALAAAWSGIDPAARAKARASVASTLADGSTDNGGADAIRALSAKLGLPSSASRDLALYIFAMLGREILAAGGS